MFVWLLKEGVTLPHGNPAAYTHKRAETARDRVLSDAELRLVWNAIGNDDFGRILKLLTLTGQRANEIAGLKWSEVVDGSIVLPSERTKNHHPHSVPLSDVAKKTLPGIGHNSRTHVFGRDDTGFSGFSKAKERLDERLGNTVAPWRIHDLRRTAASGMQRLGVRVEVIERALNHVSGSYRGVAGVYQRDPMTADVQDAMNKWARHLMALVEGRKAIVVSMKRA
jgi:integrase